MKTSRKADSVLGTSRPLISPVFNRSAKALCLLWADWVVAEWSLG